MIVIPSLIILGKILLSAYTVSRFEPLKMVLDLLPDKLIFNLINLLLTCSKCLSFWIGIIFFGDIWMGMLASLIITVLEKTAFNKLEKVTLN